MLQSDDNDEKDDIVWFDCNFDTANPYKLNEEDDDKEEVDLNDHIFDDELRACFADCSLDNNDHVIIPGLQEKHVIRYLTDGATTKSAMQKVNKARYLVRNGKVKKIKGYDRERTQTKVIGDHGIYKVEMKFKNGTIADGFKSTRQIKYAHCDCLDESGKCSHIGAKLLSMVNRHGTLQQLLKTAKYPQYKVSCVSVV